MLTAAHFLQEQKCKSDLTHFFIHFSRHTKLRNDWNLSPPHFSGNFPKISETFWP